MTLYLNKKGKYEPLSDRAIKRLRRVEPVKKVSLSAHEIARSIFALTTWLECIERRHDRMARSELVVVRKPNRERLRKLANDLCSNVDELVQS